MRSRNELYEVYNHIVLVQQTKPQRLFWLPGDLKMNAESPDL